MDERTLTALKASIEHWEANVAAETIEDVSIARISCSLCVMFYNNNKHCKGCPINNAGYPGCGYTPYDKASDAYYAWDRHQDNIKKRDAWRKAARKEVDFLRSLLPADEASP